MNRISQFFRDHPKISFILFIVFGGLATFTMIRLLNSPGLFGPILAVMILGAMILVVKALDENVDIISVSKRDIELARERVEQNPEKAKPAWDLATAKLESYLSANIKQINWIFTLSVIVLLVGFTFLMGAVFLALQKPEVITPPIVAGVGGVLTEFIGATFLVLYRSALEHSTNFIKSLDKTSSVGVAMQILDNIYADTDEGTPLKIAEAKIEIAKLLLKSLSDK